MWSCIVSIADWAVVQWLAPPPYSWSSHAVPVSVLYLALYTGDTKVAAGESANVLSLYALQLPWGLSRV